MLSRDLLREPDTSVRERLAHRGVAVETLTRWQELDGQRRQTIATVEEHKRRRNLASREIGVLKKQGQDATSAIAEVGSLKAQIDACDSELAETEAALLAIEHRLPNLPHTDVPVGDDEADFREERRIGEPRSFDFEPKNHWDLGPELGILDFERGAKIAKARFTAYFGAGARLERALINFMLDLHTQKHGYTEVIPPFIASNDSLFSTGQLPKFQEDLFKLEDENLFLSPTAEVPLTNLHRSEILSESELPIRYTAYTPCFRSEAGSHGRDVRGLIRQHQFNKVELVQLSHPETSWSALEELTGHAEKVLQLLELPYRVMTLPTGDMSISAAKTYDLEAWLPGQGRYREISSCSNCTDYQARRAGLRFRPSEGGKARLLHSLNGSGLAVGRTLIAILENYQQADGSVSIPEALRPYFGSELISAPSS